MKHVFAFLVFAVTLWTAENWWLGTKQSETSARLALGQFAGGEQAARELHNFQSLKDGVHLFSGLATLMVAVILFRSPFGRTVGRIQDLRSGRCLGRREG